MKISKLRKKLKNKKFVEKQIERLITILGALENYRKFECSSILKGSVIAQYNTYKYNRKILKYNRQFKFLTLVLKKLKNSKKC